jgi:O-antigen ligase
MRPVQTILMKNQPALARFAILFPYLLLLFPLSALSTPVGAGLIQAALLLATLAGITIFFKPRPALSDTPRLSLQALTKPLQWFLLFWLGSVMLELVILSVHGFSGSKLHSPLLRIVTAAALVLMVMSTRKTQIYWYGVIGGCFAVLAVALFQRLFLGLERATGFHNAIHFGNFSLCLGLMALVALTQLRAITLKFKILLAAAALAGILTSLLSGSRGGWIALLLIFVPLYGLSESKKQLAFIGALLAAILALAYAIPGSGVQARIADIWASLVAYESGTFNTSIGLRLEMFRASWNVFMAHPLLGVGDNFQFVIDEVARLGSHIPPGHQLNDSHNEVLYALVRGGLIGLAQLLILYLAPLTYFFKMLRLQRAMGNSARVPSLLNQDYLKAFAAAGIVLVMLTIDFGLTVNVFTRHIGKAFYFINVCFLVALCEIELNKLQAIQGGVHSVAENTGRPGEARI